MSSMFDIGWTEILVIVIVTILVVGPKELPGLLRTVGKTVGNMRKMAGDFQSQFNEALREAELEDVKNTISDARKLNPANAIKDAVTKEIGSLDDVTGDLKKDLNEAAWDFDEAMADVAARKEAAEKKADQKQASNTAVADLVDDGDAAPAPAPAEAPAVPTDTKADKSSAKAD